MRRRSSRRNASKVFDQWRQKWTVAFDALNLKVQFDNETTAHVKAECGAVRRHKHRSGSRTFERLADASGNRPTIPATK